MGPRVPTGTVCSSSIIGCSSDAQLSGVTGPLVPPAGPKRPPRGGVRFGLMPLGLRPGDGGPPVLPPAPAMCAEPGLRRPISTSCGGVPREGSVADCERDMAVGVPPPLGTALGVGGENSPAFAAADGSVAGMLGDVPVAEDMYCAKGEARWDTWWPACRRRHWIPFTVGQENPLHVSCFLVTLGDLRGRHYLGDFLPLQKHAGTSRISLCTVYLTNMQ